VLLVHEGVPATSLRELIAYAKANPGKLTFASQGNGSTGHMIGEQFKAMAGIEITHVPYRGAAPASQDLLAGHVSMLFDIVPLAVSNLQSGKVRALALCAAERARGSDCSPRRARRRPRSRGSIARRRRHSSRRRPANAFWARARCSRSVRRKPSVLTSRPRPSGGAR